MLTPTELAARSFVVDYTTPIVAGVYFIYCAANGRGYIGSTNNLYHRLRGHKAKFKRGKHENIHLQRTCDKYGIDALSFLVVEITTSDDADHLVERENHWLLQMDRELMFNMTVPALKGGPQHFQRSPEFRAAISRSLIGNKRSLGRVIPEEYKAVLAAKWKGRKVPPEETAKAQATRAATLLAHPELVRRGEQISTAKLTPDKVREIRRLWATGEYFQREIGEMFGVKQSQIWCVLSGKTWSHVK